jgi:pSer/pThr/pTyr-binding forkhead associated (FHA) protein
MEVYLIVASGKQVGKKIAISSPKFLIGRGEECHLRPQSSLVSRKHCVILVEEGSAAIEDLGSTNGTFVNDEKLEQRRELKSGDRIRVGMLGLEVQLAAGAVDKKKSDAPSVQQAAARTVAASATEDDFDVSRWLGEDDESSAAPPRKKESSVGEDTIAGKSLIDTTAMPVPPPHKQEKEKERKEEEEEKKEKKKQEPAVKTLGKFHRPTKPTTESSGEAADDALRHFFHRKKP